MSDRQLPITPIINETQILIWAIFKLFAFNLVQEWTIYNFAISNFSHIHYHLFDLY